MSIFGKVIAKKQRVPDFMEHGVQLKTAWRHCSETTSTGYAYVSGCAWWCTRHFLAWHRLTSLNYAFPLLQSVLVLHSGQRHTAFCSSRGPVWSLASVRSPSQALPLGTMCMTVFGAHQHVTSLNSVWRLISSDNQIACSFSWAVANYVPIFSVRRPCSVHWHVTPFLGRLTNCRIIISSSNSST